MKKNISLILFILFCTNIYAQTDSTRSSIELNEVIISANKEEESKTSVAQQVEVIKSRDIQNMNTQSTADLLQASGNVVVQKSQQGGGSPVIRGFEASRVLLVIDGVRMNNLIYRAGHLQNVITIDQSVLDRVEILYGPSSTVYGSDALGGVVHFYTKKTMLSSNDTSLFSGNSYFRYGTVNSEKTGHVDFNYGTKKIASLTSFTYSTFDDLKMGKKKGLSDSLFGVRYYYIEHFNGKDSLVLNDDKYRQRFSGFHQYDLLQKFLYQPGENTFHQLNFQLSNSSDIPRYDRLTDPASNGLRFADWYYGPQLRIMGAYDFNKTRLKGFFNTFHAGISYQNIEESRHQRRFESNNLESRTEKVGVVGFTADAHRITTKHSFRIGAEGQFNRLKSAAVEKNISTGEEVSLDTRYPNGDNTMNYLAAYYTHTFHISDKWVLNDGLRLQYIALKSIFEDKTFFPFPFDEAKQNHFAISGNAGLIFLPKESWKLALNISTGFRVPNVDDLAKVFESSDGSIVVPNPDLRPEKTYNLDLTIARVFSEKVKWENTGFYTLFEDAIVTDKFLFNGEDSIDYDGELSEVLASQNRNSAYITGFSTGIRVQITNYFSAGASLSYTYGRVKTDTTDIPLDHVPPLFARIEMKYEKNNFSGGLFVLYNDLKKLSDYSGSGEDNAQYATPIGMPAWYTLNAIISYRINKHLQVQAGCENIIDTQYRTFASGINGPGRNLSGTLRVQW